MRQPRGRTCPPVLRTSISRMFCADKMNKRSFLKDYVRTILMMAFKHNGKGKKGHLIEDLVKLDAQFMEGRTDCVLRS